MLAHGKNFILIDLARSMIIDVIVASTSRFKRYGAVSNPEQAEDLSGQTILDLIKQRGSWPAISFFLTA